mgnify:CR=1 FL=1
MSEYIPLKLNLNAKQQKALLNGKAIKLLCSQVNNGPIVLLYKSNYNKIMKMKDLCNLSLSKGEILASAERNGILKNMGGNIFTDIWDGLKSVGKFIENNATPILDAVSLAATPFFPIGSTVAREGIRALTGKSIGGMARYKGKFLI